MDFLLNDIHQISKINVNNIVIIIVWYQKKLQPISILAATAVNLRLRQWG